MDLGIRDAPVSCTSSARPERMGPLTGRADRTGFAAGPGAPRRRRPGGRPRAPGAPRRRRPGGGRMRGTARVGRADTGRVPRLNDPYKVYRKAGGLVGAMTRRPRANVRLSRPGWWCGGSRLVRSFPAPVPPNEALRPGRPGLSPDSRERRVDLKQLEEEQRVVTGIHEGPAGAPAPCAFGAVSCGRSSLPAPRSWRCSLRPWRKGCRRLYGVPT